MNEVIVSGSFDNLRTPHFRFLDEASKIGPVHVLLWSDNVIRMLDGVDPRFPYDERLYFIQALRYVSQVTCVEELADGDTLPPLAALEKGASRTWVVPSAEDTVGRWEYCQANGLNYAVIGSEQTEGFPTYPAHTTPGRKKVVVTGCYDWLHTGHVRFFEECSQFGDLYVIVGNDANVENLKGCGHPMFPEHERRYLVQSIRYVTQGLITSGWGWMDAEPEIEVLKPDIYVVNEDGDRPEKRAFCDEHGLEYVVLKRSPRPGLPRRESTKLRGF